MRKKIVLLCCSFAIGLALYMIFFRQIALKLRCMRIVNTKIANFRSAAFRLGVIKIDEEEAYIKSIYPKLYQQCLTN